MLYREIIAVCSEIHTKHINTVCGQNVELLNVKMAVHTMYSNHWSLKVWIRLVVVFTEVCQHFPNIVKIAQ